MSTPHRTFKQRMLDPRNRRSKNIEDRRMFTSPLDSVGYPRDGATPDLTQPVNSNRSRIVGSNATGRDRMIAAAAVKDWLPEKPKQKYKFSKPSKVK